MKREPQNDLRYIKTEALIRQTFRQMLGEMEYSQVSVKELTERAMINRKTFYLHYSTLDELLGKLQTEMYEELLKIISNMEAPCDLEKRIRELFTFSENTDDVDKKILYSQGNFPPGKSPGDQARKKIFQDYGMAGCKEYEKNMIDAYINGSLYFMYLQWTLDGKKISLEDMICFTARLIAQGVENLRQASIDGETGI